MYTTKRTSETLEIRLCLLSSVNIILLDYSTLKVCVKKKDEHIPEQIMKAFKGKIVTVY
jgi:hypothetical protein